ncbi:MAG: MFS transporter [Bacteroidales bacterium]|jgi:fucose permease|nr:MFS transporter [Bacteroidales bacterium]
MKKSTLILSLLPVFLGFFVMGFVDVVGIATNYFKDTYGLSERLSGFLPSMIFIWFLVFAIPSATLMNKIGRKNTVLLSMLVTIIGMFLPFTMIANLTLSICIVAFCLLGIGNTILQVSLNPLVSNVVEGKYLASSLTAGQVVKALCAFCAPLITTFAATQLGNWMYIFPIFGGITLLAALWLLLTPIKKEEPSTSASFIDSFKLLGNKIILMLFIGILVVVGIDVGVNMVSVKVLINHFDYNANDVYWGPMTYSLCRTIGAFIGAALLAKMNEMKYFRIHVLLALVVIGLLLVAPSDTMAYVLFGAIGYAFSSIFSIIFSVAMKARPDKTNEVAGLMVTAIAGGAIFPPIMTFANSLFSDTKQYGAIIVLMLITCYLVYLAFAFLSKKKVEN